MLTLSAQRGGRGTISDCSRCSAGRSEVRVYAGQQHCLLLGLWGDLWFPSPRAFAREGVTHQRPPPGARAVGYLTPARHFLPTPLGSVCSEPCEFHSCFPGIRSPSQPKPAHRGPLLPSLTQKHPAVAPHSVLSLDPGSLTGTPATQGLIRQDH